MNTYQNIKHFIATHALIERNDIIIVGLSGGPDSVFLLHFLVELTKEIPLTLIVAHLNHEWRQEATAEEQFCREMANKFGLKYISKPISGLTLLMFRPNGSKEEYARKVRRFFLEGIAYEYNATSIALAHHLQDQEETFFIRLIRGSSLTGLTAMQPRNGLYIRPLLETHKTDILNWLHTYNIPYAIDASNESQDYLRNRIRSTVLPALRKCDNRFETNFLATLQRLQETEDFLNRLTEKKFARISTKVTNSKPFHCARSELVAECNEYNKTNNCDCSYYSIDISHLLKFDPILQHRMILYWLIQEKVPFSITQAFLNEILRFLNNPRGGFHTIHKEWAIVKKRKKASLIKI